MDGVLAAVKAQGKNQLFAVIIAQRAAPNEPYFRPPRHSAAVLSKTSFALWKGKNESSPQASAHTAALPLSAPSSSSSNSFSALLYDVILYIWRGRGRLVGRLVRLFVVVVP